MRHGTRSLRPEGTACNGSVPRLSKKGIDSRRVKTQYRYRLRHEVKVSAKAAWERRCGNSSIFTLMYGQNKEQAWKLHLRLAVC
jgi:hypothetical protein